MEAWLLHNCQPWLGPLFGWYIYIALLAWSTAWCIGLEAIRIQKTNWQIISKCLEMSASGKVAPPFYNLVRGSSWKVIESNIKSNITINSVATMFLAWKTAMKTCHQFFAKSVPSKYYPLSLLRLESGGGRYGWEGKRKQQLRNIFQMFPSGIILTYTFASSQTHSTNFSKGTSLEKAEVIGPWSPVHCPHMGPQTGNQNILDNFTVFSVDSWNSQSMGGCTGSITTSFAVHSQLWIFHPPQELKSSVKWKVVPLHKNIETSLFKL